MSEDFNMDVQEDSDVRKSFIYKIDYSNKFKINIIIKFKLVLCLVM